MEGRRRRGSACTPCISINEAGWLHMSAPGAACVHAAGAPDRAVRGVLREAVHRRHRLLGGRWRLALLLRQRLQELDLVGQAVGRTRRTQSARRAKREGWAMIEQPRSRRRCRRQQAAAAAGAAEGVGRSDPCTVYAQSHGSPDPRTRRLRGGLLGLFACSGVVGRPLPVRLAAHRTTNSKNGATGTRHNAERLQAPSPWPSRARPPASGEFNPGLVASHCRCSVSLPAPLRSCLLVTALIARVRGSSVWGAAESGGAIG